MIQVATITAAVLLFTLSSATESLTHFRLETAILPCVAYPLVSMQTNSTTVRWEGPGGLTVNSTDISVLATTRISLLMTEDFSLQIESLDLTDSGSYRCIVHGWWSNATSDVVNNATLDITTM